MSKFWDDAAALAADLAKPVTAFTIPAVPLRRPAPQGWKACLAAFLVYGWKATGCWVCVVVLAVNGVVIPVAGIWHTHLAGLEWKGITLFAGTLLGLRIIHAVEAITGADA